MLGVYNVKVAIKFLLGSQYVMTNDTNSGVAGGVLCMLPSLDLKYYASLLHFPLQASFFHLLRLCSSFTVHNMDPTFFVWGVCFLYKTQILILGLPLQNALTIHCALSACEATLQGN